MAVEIAIDTLGAARCAELVGRSVKLVYAWSDEHGDPLPNARQMLALDKACREAGVGTPFADCYTEALEYQPAPEGLDPDRCMSRLVASIGRVCDHHESCAGAFDGANRKRSIELLYEARGRLDTCIDAVQGVGSDGDNVEALDTRTLADRKGEAS